VPLHHYHSLKWRAVSKYMVQRLEALRLEDDCIDSGRGDAWNTLSGPMLEYTARPVPLRLQPDPLLPRGEHGRWVKAS